MLTISNFRSIHSKNSQEPDGKRMSLQAVVGEGRIVIKEF